MSKKKIKRLVLLVLFLVVLFGIYAGVTIVQEKREAQEAEEADIAENGFLIQQMDEDSIVGFSFQHPGDENYDDSVYTFAKSGDTWYYKDDLDFPVNQSIITLCVEDLANVYAKRLLEETDENFASYGLDDPNLIITVTDGSQTITYNIGDYNASTADYYLNIEGTDTVYTVDGTLWVDFDMELYDTVEVESFPSIQDDHIVAITVETPDGTSYFDFEITGTETDETYGTVTNTGDWYVIDSEGERVLASSTKMSTLVSLLTGIEYVQEINYNATEEELAEYGLDNPSVVITIDYIVYSADKTSVETVEVTEGVSETVYDTIETEKQLVFSIGNTSPTFSYTDDYCVMTNESTAVVTLDAETAELFAEIVADDYVSVDKID